MRKIDKGKGKELEQQTSHVAGLNNHRNERKLTGIRVRYRLPLKNSETAGRQENGKNSATADLAGTRKSSEGWQPLQIW